MSKKKTSFTLNIDLLKDLKMKAVELGTSQTKLLEKFIKQGLEISKEDHSLINDNSGTIILDNIKPILLKKINKIAKKEKITEKEAIIQILEKGLEFKSKNKIPDHLIANKDTYNPDHERLMSFSGIIETDEPVDVEKVIREVRTREY